MTSLVVFVAMALAIAVLARRGVEQAFLQVWIPVFLALPFAFWVHAGLPNTNFAQAATIPIVAVLVLTRRAELRVGVLEVLIAVYVVLRVVVDGLSRGYWNAQNYTYFLLTMVIGPYLLGRYVIDGRRMDVAAARRFVLVFLLFFPLFLYEAKFWVSPIFRLLSPLFPDAASGLSLRWGLARTAGTFEHPILACIMVLAVYRLHRWLAWSGEWDRPQEGLLGQLQRATARLPLPFHWMLAAALLLMAAMTISRGPWIGGALGAVVAAAGNARDRRRALWSVLAVAVIAGAAGKLALDAYLTPRAGSALSADAQTMLYRQVMVDRYKAFLMEHLWRGWGLTDVPKIPGMESVDNAFFLMALQHGILAPVLFTAIFIWAIGTQLVHGLKAPPGVAPLGFTFSGIYVMCAVSFATVYMGAQTEPMLFLLLGWGESVRCRGSDAAEGPATAGVTPPQPFRHVMR